MRRRSFLAGAPAAALALSGCVGAFGAVGTDESPNRPADAAPKSARQATRNGFEFDRTESPSAGESSVGSVDAATDAGVELPWRLLVWNDADEARPISVSVFGESLGRALAETVEFPAGAHSLVKLFEPDDYTIQVQAGDRVRHEHRIAVDRFDCNAHTTRFRVAPTGDVEYVTSATMVYCGDPT